MELIRGPLGIWPFPILNFLLQVVQFSRSSAGFSTESSSKLENLEVIEWVDWKGRERKMTIHREVK